MEYNGGAVLAMKGKECVVIACDKKLGADSIMISNEYPKIFRMTERLFLGMTGLKTDAQTLFESLRAKINIRKLKLERDIKPETFAHLLSSSLYEKRFGPYYISPIVAGLSEDENGKAVPFICSTDLIGCINQADDFVVSGACSEGMYGMCESLYKEDAEPEELFEIVSQSLMSAFDRDATSGMGAVVYILTRDKLITRELKTRQD